MTVIRSITTFSRDLKNSSHNTVRPPLSHSLKSAITPYSRIRLNRRHLLGTLSRRMRTVPLQCDGMFTFARKDSRFSSIICMKNLTSLFSVTRLVTRFGFGHQLAFDTMSPQLRGTRSVGVTSTHATSFG